MSSRLVSIRVIFNWVTLFSYLSRCVWIAEIRKQVLLVRGFWGGWDIAQRCPGRPAHAFLTKSRKRVRQGDYNLPDMQTYHCVRCKQATEAPGKDNRRLLCEKASIACCSPPVGGETAATAERSQNGSRASFMTPPQEGGTWEGVRWKSESGLWAFRIRIHFRLRRAFCLHC